MCQNFRAQFALFVPPLVDYFNVQRSVKGQIADLKQAPEMREEKGSEQEGIRHWDWNAEASNDSLTSIVNMSFSCSQAQFSLPSSVDTTGGASN